MTGERRARGGVLWAAFGLAGCAAGPASQPPEPPATALVPPPAPETSPARPTTPAKPAPSPAPPAQATCDRSRLRPPSTAPVSSGGGPPALGMVAVDQVRRVVSSRNHRYRLCFENGLTASPGLNNRVAVRLSIDGEGRVKTADAGQFEGVSSAVAECVACEMLELVFPPFGKDVVIVYPISFSPGG